MRSFLSAGKMSTRNTGPGFCIKLNDPKNRISHYGKYVFIRWLDNILIAKLLIIYFQNTVRRFLFNRIVLLFLQRFFIGYWILKTGLNFHSGPFFLTKIKKAQHFAAVYSFSLFLKYSIIKLVFA